MTNENKNKQTGSQNRVASDVAKRIQVLFGDAIRDIKIIADSINSVSNTVSNRKTIDTDNAVKLNKVETESQKEENRHSEAMANIELEYKKISEATTNGELKWSWVHEVFQMIKEEYSKLNNMDDTMFISEEAIKSRDNLRRTIVELYKETIHA